MTTTDVFLKDELAESLARLADASPEARELLSVLRDGWGRADATAKRPRMAVRGLTGSARAYLISWLQRQVARPVLYVVPHGEHFESARDDIEYFRGRGATLAFPEPDTLPYDPSSPHPSVTAERLETLGRLAAGESGVVVATVRGVLQRVPRPEKLARSILTLRTGEDVDSRALLERLVFMGYERFPEVEAVGHFARRGGILDIYPVGQSDPLRLEFDGDTIASLRRFDAGTQRSLEKCTEARVLPRYEIVVEPSEAEGIAQRLRDAGDEKAQGGANLFHEGMERFAGYYDTQLASLLDYLPSDALIILDDPATLDERVDELTENIQRGFEETRAHYPMISPPEQLFHPRAVWDAMLDARRGADWMGSVAESGEAARYAQTLFIDCRPAEPLQRSMEKLKNHLAELNANDLEPVILCDNQGQRDRLFEMLGNAGATLGVGLVSAGFTWKSAGLALLTDHEIFARYRRRRRRLRRTGGLSIAELSQLKPGDYVVHEDHGVGMYKGMKRLTLSGQETDCLELSYAGKDVLYVPVHQLSLVSRYAAGEGARPAIHSLGSAQWAKTKARAKKAIQDMADELLKAYAARKALPGHAFKPDSVWQKELEASFPYDETPDQLTAIEDVRGDMEAPSPMDRLICGDVGYGKTEVAVRAAFKAVSDGKQVAILVPTTVLAEQHGNTFRERVAGFPVRVEVLSRFRSDQQQREIVKAITAGEVDIAIGTHRLLQKDVEFKDLGLIVIDEEQRFGVSHKERLKQMRAEVDSLTLSATPIPRTLQMSLVGIRDMSTVMSPPEERIPIRTYVMQWDSEILREAIEREMERGGQVYFVHNRVHNIERIVTRLREIVPEARIAVGHGQMPEDQLERVMMEFGAGDQDVLVCTTIIESGLDIPNANTIIINDANHLGLAQLYQLRGRVGRGANRAYAYLLYDKDRAMSEAAQKRLEAVFEATELGAGFQIALRDLEIRGAGNVLGNEQSGHIAAVGFDMYSKLVAEAVSAIKAAVPPNAQQGPPPLPPPPSIDLPLSAHIPENYIPETHARLATYQRVADIETAEGVSEMQAELADRFGPVPRSVENLLYVALVKSMARRVRVESIKTDEQMFHLRVRGGVTEAMRARIEALNHKGLLVGPNQVRIDRIGVGANWMPLVARVLRAMADER